MCIIGYIFMTTLTSELLLLRTPQLRSRCSRLYTFIRPIILVLVMGCLRYLTVKGVNYQEHVTEYGVHWNFYFTLAGVYLLFSTCQVLGSWATSPAVAAILSIGTSRRLFWQPLTRLSVGYQVYLSSFGGEDFIINAPRENLFSQNREGILSLFGMPRSTLLYINLTMILRLHFSLPRFCIYGSEDFFVNGLSWRQSHP